MKLIAVLSSPLYVHTTKSRTAKGKFILNLNNYRNADPMKLNKAKIEYKKQMTAQINTLPRCKRIAIRYTNFKATRRRIDTNNVCSIHDKFFADALVELGVIIDDDDEHVTETAFRPGGVAKDNPRVEIEIYETA